MKWSSFMLASCQMRLEIFALFFAEANPESKK